jgi:small subunit ribosomal protein S6
MKRYELVFLADPRLAEEDVVALTDEYRSMLTANGGSIVKEESWGKKRLAYPIRKLTEGYYVLYNVEMESGSPLAEVERRMQQNDKILRYLTVRLDAGRLRERPDRSAEDGAASAGEEQG